jgi:hypothetical protein
MIITPETKIGELLETYPGLEEILISLSPEFAKLQNPLLRKTVGSVATLKQLAQMGGVPLADLINKLRQESGDTSEFLESHPSSVKDSEKPSWVIEADIAIAYDAREDLAMGMHPAQRVVRELGGIEPSKLYKLTTPFLPSPLLEMIHSKGFVSWSRQDGPGEIHTYFRKA